MPDNQSIQKHRLTKGQEKSGKMLPGLMTLDFCCDIQMIGPDFGAKSFVLMVQCGVEDIFLAYFGPLSTN